jgi:hypothetical protein
LALELLFGLEYLFDPWASVHPEVAMSSQLGPIDICCDAPPYQVVQACRNICIQAPEDVRWLRMSEFRSRLDRRPQGLSLLFWKMFWKRGEPAARTCTCGEPLPELRLAVVTFNTGAKACYLIGQCCRCRTVFWDEP